MKLTFILFLAICLTLTGTLSVGAGMNIPAGTPPPGAEDSQRISVSGQETIVPEGARISNDEARLALARVLAREETTQAEARRIFQALLKERPDDPEVLAGLADLSLASGHAEECRDLYLRILVLEGTEARRLDYADRMSAWGDFYGAERIYREFLDA
ncbi:MAG: tetratricopeptide repeat protein, partial [bacterium]